LQDEPSKFDFGDADGERHLLLYGVQIDDFKSSKKILVILGG
jgi:hypothetical protein